MKKVVSLFLVIITLFSVITTAMVVADAASSYSNGTYAIDEPLGVNLRKGAGTKYAKVTAIPNKTQIVIVEVKGNWGRTTYKGKTGWLCLDYTKFISSQNDSIAVGQYIITAKEGVNIRTNAGSSYKKVGAVKYNTTVTVTSIKNNWGYIGTGWICLDYAKQITTSNDTVVSAGIPSSAYVKTGEVYTASGTSYYQAKTTRAYNGIAKDSVFYVDSKGAVVNNATVLNKLYTLELFNNIRSNQQSAASLWASAADDYYHICTTVAKNEKMGSLIGKTSGILLSVGAGNSFGIQEAALEVGGEVCSPETVKTAVLLGMLRIYSNNAEVYGNQAANLMKNKITDYDAMVKAANAYAECAANFAAVEYLGGDTVREMANSSVGKELTKYFKNVFVGFADSVIPDIKSVQITKYVTDGVIALGDFTANSGAQSVYNKALSKQKEYLSSTYASAKTMADKLRQNESLKFVKSLTSNYSTNITTQKWGAYYSGNGYHLGVDLGTSGNKSTTVGSIADGVVYRVAKESKSGGWGNLVIVKHTLPNGKVFYSGYAHLKSMSVKEGQAVNTGTKLGMMGSTGYSTGPHLHLLVFTGPFNKSSLPKGYASKKFSGDNYTIGGLTYYDPLKVISSSGDIIK